MGYEAALKAAWSDVKKVAGDTVHKAHFFGELFSVHPKECIVYSEKRGGHTSAHTAILVLHYLKKRLQGLPRLTGKWISFKELPGGEIYYPAFRKRAIEPVLKRYALQPEILREDAAVLSGRTVSHGDVGVVIDALEGVPILVVLWTADEEFSAEANILFDRSIAEIFSTEDVAVLAGFVTARLRVKR